MALPRVFLTSALNASLKKPQVKRAHFSVFRVPQFFRIIERNQEIPANWRYNNWLRIDYQIEKPEEDVGVLIEVTSLRGIIHRFAYLYKELDWFEATLAPGINCYCYYTAPIKTVGAEGKKWKQALARAKKELFRISC